MRPSLRFLPLVLLVLWGCDTAVTGEESVFITIEISADVQDAPVRFTFQANDLAVGRLEDVECSCELDIGSFLADRGFAREDIVGATLESARLVMLFPISERLDFLDQAILKLRAPGNSITEVAQQNAFPESREVSLDPRSGRDVAGFLDDSTFEPLLQIDATRLQADADYEIGLVMTLRLQIGT